MKYFVMFLTTRIGQSLHASWVARCRRVAPDPRVALFSSTLLPERISDEKISGGCNVTEAAS